MLTKSNLPIQRLIACVAVVAVCAVFSSDSVSARESPESCVQIGVLTLFHPKEFRVSAVTGQALILRAGADSIPLETSSGVDAVTVEVSGVEVVARAGAKIIQAPELSFVGRQTEPVDFILAIPGKITRRYHGTLQIRPSHGNLLAIVSLELETAVASVVAAESSAGTPVEALKAQAVAARSYFVSGQGRHRDFDYCDTTHCQFLRNPPEQRSAAASAVEQTRGLVLAYQSHPFAAMYTRSCSGRTHTPAEIGIPSGSYPYYAVECEYCRAHPYRWTSRISARAAGLLRTTDESSRLDLDRRLGWSTVPSNDFLTAKDGDQIVLNGVGQGHAVGLCQAGARAMAEKGANFREILSHYYPNTTIMARESSKMF